LHSNILMTSLSGVPSHQIVIYRRSESTCKVDQNNPHHLCRILLEFSERTVGKRVHHKSDPGYDDKKMRSQKEHNYPDIWSSGRDPQKRPDEQDKVYYRPEDERRKQIIKESFHDREIFVRRFKAFQAHRYLIKLCPCCLSPVL